MSGQPTVRTTEGVVQGRRRKGHAVFRGIPYARPPVGALRFAAPAPPHRWEGTRPAVEFGPVVPLSLPIDVPPQGTDWLTLDIGTPDPGAAGLPVLVWLPVGGYVSAVSSDPMYDPAALAEAGVVVVTVNCRVGAEGFAFLDDAPPNRGFLDQIAALEWVQRNIAAFGGDPSRVTVGGTSAGAGSVAALLTMESARGLFRRAIAHSVPGLHSTPALARQVTAAFADRLGAQAPTAEALRDIDPWHLAAELTSFNAGLHAHRDRWGRITDTGTALCPVVDGEVLPDTPWSALTGARARGIDLLVGHARDEFRYFSVMSGRHGTYTEEDARAALELHAPQPDGASAYRAAFAQAGPEELVEAVYSDALFRMPSQKLAEANAAAGGTSYLFELCWAAPVRDGILGACHSLDLPLAFGTLDSPVGAQLVGAEPSSEAVALSRELQGAWVRFVTTGDAGWSAHRPGELLTRALDAESKTLPYPEQASRQIWEGHPPAPFACP
ncbi:carboxylesterase family protein [Streptomyces sp. SID5785]|uniref:carboxylesterase/lipase family protein n=1 Tax=Streptomyces sp. SID5785 TaxID=2690309 RepID=UPI001361E376|nr:carboxylesterase family protein [Streptomyces sp. SID5785]MZD05799.1 carboxylesterase family protein [Streptomyces sp. SID5785]